MNNVKKPDIFRKRLNLKPSEYPHLEKYKDAVRHSYWLHTMYSYTSDKQDYLINVTEEERNVIKNAMIAISQIEISVKTFWGDLFSRIPKPEVGAVGYTFSDSEVRHYDAYSFSLELLGLNDEFENIHNIPELMQRITYLEDSLSKSKTESNRDYTKSILLFSLFIEHVSLFSQFLIMMSFNKHKNLFKGLSNVIEATSKEEQIHGLFGIEIINIIKEENPEWFDEDMENEVIEACKEAYRSEEIVIDWIYEKGDLDFMPKKLVKEYVKSRLNDSLNSIGYDSIFDVDVKLLEETDWFDDEIIATKNGDFFDKHNVNYYKNSRSITSSDLF